MAVVVVTSGQQAHTIGVEHTLTTIAPTAGSYQLVIDCSALLAGEHLEVRYYGKCRSTDAELQEDVFSIEGGQANPLVKLPIILSPHYAKFTSKQVDGTGRSLPWAVYGI